MRTACHDIADAPDVLFDSLLLELTSKTKANIYLMIILLYYLFNYFILFPINIFLL